MSRRSSIDYVWGLLVFSFIESSILTIRCVFILFLVFKLYKLYKSSLQLIHIILNHLIFLSSVDIGDYLVVAYFRRWIFKSCLSFRCFFCDLKIVHVMPVYHTMSWKWKMFHLKVFSTGIHKKCKSNHYLLLPAIFHDLEMT